MLGDMGVRGGDHNRGSRRSYEGMCMKRVNVS